MMNKTALVSGAAIFLGVLAVMTIFFESDQTPVHFSEESIQEYGNDQQNSNLQSQADNIREDSSSRTTSTQLGALGDADDFLLELQQNIEREYGPLDLAQIAFDKNWAYFVSSLSLSNLEKFQIRDLLIQKDAQDFEIAQLVIDGNISDQDLLDYFSESEKFEDRFSEILSPAQMEGYLENKEAIKERLDSESEQIIERQLANNISDILFFSEIGDLETVLAYIASGADVNSRPLDGSTSPLHNAIAARDIEMVNALIASGADVNWRTENRNQSPLDIAALVGNTEIIQSLISSGANVNSSRPGFDEFSPLVGAALNNRTEAVAELLRSGADATGASGIEALQFAIWHRNSNMEAMLIDAGADSNDPAVVSTRISALESPLNF